MNAEEKKALIEWLEEGIACSDEYGFSGNVLKSMKIALAALTAQPVKRPATKCIGWVRDSIHEHDAKWVEAIRDAGYEVQE